MSNYTSEARNPVSGEIEEVAMLDNYYGDRKWAVRFPNGEVLPKDKVEIIGTEQ